MADSKTFIDYYAILDIGENATDAEIREAIKGQRHVWVKRTGLPDLERRQQAERRVSELDDAERTLLEPGRRAAFDEARRNAPAEPLPTFGGSNRLEDSLPVGTDAGGDWLDRAREFLHKGEFSSANFAAKEALNTNEAGHEAWSIRAHSALAMGELQEAEFSFNEAIRLKPNEAEYHFDLGCALEAVGNDSAAQKKFQDAVDLEPDNPVYQTAVASVLLSSGNAAAALPIMESVVAKHPDNRAFSGYLAWALADNYGEYATILNDGTFLITSEAQANRMVKDMERAQRLHIEDPELRQHIDLRLATAQRALKKKWKRPTGLLGWAWAIAFVVCGSVPTLGWFLLASWLGAFIYFNIVAEHTISKRAAKGARAVRTWGIT